jgi:SAM-dependent methyltransferase
MTILNNCPTCGGRQFAPFISCKDFTVSSEVFTIVRCIDCGLKFTNPRPEDSILGNYYKSEDYISHSNTKRGLIANLYHLVRSYTLSRKEKLLRRYVSRGTLLDYGCGTGMFLKFCVSKGWEATGLEPDPGARKLASENGSSVVSVKEELPPIKYDAICLWHVLEHVSDLDGTVSFLKQRLSRDGVMVIALPNANSFDAAYYGEFWAAYDLPRHLYHFSPDTIKHFMGKHGFIHLDSRPMFFDAFYVSLLSEKYRSGKARLIPAFLTGLRSNLRARSAEEYSSVTYIFKLA